MDPLTADDHSVQLEANTGPCTVTAEGFALKIRLNVFDFTFIFESEEEWQQLTGEVVSDRYVNKILFVV